MILQQYYLGCLAHASYLIADEGTRTAVVVDPQRDIDLYLKDTESRGLEIRHVFLSHSHADFIAGHLELRDRFGAKIHLGARAEAKVSLWIKSMVYDDFASTLQGATRRRTV